MLKTSRKHTKSYGKLTLKSLFNTATTTTDGKQKKIVKRQLTVWDLFFRLQDQLFGGF